MCVEDECDGQRQSENVGTIWRTGGVLLIIFLFFSYSRFRERKHNANEEKNEIELREFVPSFYFWLSCRDIFPAAVVFSFLYIRERFIDEYLMTDSLFANILWKYNSCFFFSFGHSE